MTEDVAGDRVADQVVEELAGELLLAGYNLQPLRHPEPEGDHQDRADASLRHVVVQQMPSGSIPGTADGTAKLWVPGGQPWASPSSGAIQADQTAHETSCLVDHCDRPYRAITR